MIEKLMAIDSKNTRIFTIFSGDIKELSFEQLKEFAAKEKEGIIKFFLCDFDKFLEGKVVLLSEKSFTLKELPERFFSDKETVLLSYKTIKKFEKN